MNKVSVFHIYNILRSIRGAVSVADYPFVVLSALLLKWAELKNQKEGFDTYKEIYAPARLSATYGMADTADQIIEYLFQIEESQRNIYGGYLSEVSQSLRGIPPKDFSDILRAISMEDFSSDVDLYDFAVEFMVLYSKENGKSAYSEFTTTAVRQIEKIAFGNTDATDSVFDGFAGTGISAINATSGQGSLVLQDINPRMACIAEIICILKGCTATINVKDSINSDSEEKYNMVIAEPPFSDKMMTVRGIDLPFFSPDPDIMCIRYALSKLKDDGKGVILCPAGALFRGGKTGVDREALVCNKYIDTVIQLPVGAMFGVGISTSILILRKDKTDDGVLFIDASQLLESADKLKSDMIITPENEELIRTVIDDRREIENLSCIVQVRDLANHEFSLVATQYIRKAEIKLEYIDIYHLTVEKKELSRRLSSIEEELEIVRHKYVDFET